MQWRGQKHHQAARQRHRQSREGHRTRLTQNLLQGLVAEYESEQAQDDEQQG